MQKYSRTKKEADNLILGMLERLSGGLIVPQSESK